MMVIVNPDIINKWEMELIESLAAALDAHEVRSLFKDKYGLRLKENFESARGRIVAFKNQIVYELRFKAISIFSVFIDRSGNYQGFSRPIEKDALNEGRSESDTKLSDPEVIKRKERELIDAIASGLNIKDLGTLFEKEFKLQILGDAQCRHGDLIVFKDHVGFQLDFEVAINFSLLVDRNGNYLTFGDSNDHPIASGKVADIDIMNETSDNGSDLIIPHDPGP